MELIFMGEPKCEKCPDFTPCASLYRDPLYDDFNDVTKRRVAVNCEYQEDCEYLKSSFADKLCEFTKQGYRFDFFEEVLDDGDRSLTVCIHNSTREKHFSMGCIMADQRGVISNEELCHLVSSAYQELIKMSLREGEN